jgi:hypothetical protein
VLRHLASKLSELPFRENNAGLFVDGRHERREHLVHVADGVDAAHSSTLCGGAFTSSLGAGIPDSHLGVETADGIGVGLCEGSVDALLDHEVLDETARAAEGTGEIGVGTSHRRHTGSFLLLADELSLSLLGCGEVGSLCVDAELVGMGIGSSLFSEKSLVKC